MYTEFGKYNDKSVYLDGDSILFLNGKDSEEYINLKNELELKLEKRNSLKRGIPFYKNKYAKGKFTKQILSKILFSLFVLSGVIGVTIHYFVPFINTLYIVGYGMTLAILFDIDDRLQKSAKIDCDNKIKHLEIEIDRCNVDIDTLLKWTNELEKDLSCESISISKINKVDELKKIKETYLSEYNVRNDDKKLIKR